MVNRTVPAPTVWPSDVRPTLVNVDDEHSSPFGFVQGIRIPNDRRKVDLTWSKLENDNRLEMTRWLEEASHTDVYTLVSPITPSIGIQGAGVSTFTELLANNDFTNGVTGWSTTNATLKDALRRLKIINTTTGDATAYQDIGLNINEPYILLTTVKNGSHNLFGTRIYDTTGAVDLATIDVTTEGVIAIVGVPTATRDHRIKLVSRASTPAGDELFYLRSSLARCARVDGASQLGTNLLIKDLPASTDAILKAGEFVTILTDMTTTKANPKMEIKKLTENLDSDGSGNGRLYFEPAIRNAPLDNAPVVIHNPQFYSKFPPGGDYNEGLTKPALGSFSTSLIEDLQAP